MQVFLVVIGSCWWSLSWSLGLARRHGRVLLVVLVVVTVFCSWSWLGLARGHGGVSLVVFLVVAWVLLVVVGSRLR